MPEIVGTVMLSQAISFVQIVQFELLLFAGACFLIGALDDFLIDCIWLYGWLKDRNSAAYRISAPDLRALTTDSMIAVFVPAWNESAVIGKMLAHCVRSWGDRGYRLYVGCYPNDPASIQAACAAAEKSDRIRIILCQHPGPTSKADCLNHLWLALLRDEHTEGFRASTIVLQDAEDIVHRDALRLFHHFIQWHDMVQIPVVPLRQPGRMWIAGHYGDEFAEMHGKQMVVRGSLSLSLPSAGVGCAIGREALELIAQRNPTGPFALDSITEDYELGIGLINARSPSVFVRMRDADGNLIATKEFFPDNLRDAVVQKSRWMTGIALAGWDRIGWQGGWRENWMLIRDRKSSFAAFVLSVAYLAIVLTGFLALAQLAGWRNTSIVPAILVPLLWINAGFLVWRLIWRMAFVQRQYGLREAVLGVPRLFVGNIVNIIAARRSLFQYWSYLRGNPLVWHATPHFAHLDAPSVDLRTQK